MASKISSKEFYWPQCHIKLTIPEQQFHSCQKNLVTVDNTRKFAARLLHTNLKEFIILLIWNGYL